MKKDLQGFVKLSRLAPLNHLRAATIAPGAHGPLSAYSPTNLWAWAMKVGRYWLRKKHALKAYAVPGGGVHRAENRLTLSVAGDWGTGTDEAAGVAAQIRAFAPDYTAHLGDVYYVGSAAEVEENFLGVKASAYEPVAWPTGRLGTFALLGNHDMYSNGDAYFDALLPAIGQGASFFALENDHWRIIGLDTGYHSTGVDLWPFRPSCKLPDELLAWLATLALNADQRGLVLLSHHQPLSAFEHAYETPAEQLAKLIARPVLWLWGHEHRLVIYRDVETVRGLKILGRCVGHGGMPIELKAPKDARSLITDARRYPNAEGLTIGYNGHANLTFDGRGLTVKYVDLEGKEIFEEKRSCDDFTNHA